jgi:hypothetical protein
MLRDMKSQHDVVQGLPPAGLRANATYPGASVDLQGYYGAMVCFSIGPWTDGTHTPSLLESADNATFTPVAASDMRGSFTAVTSAVGQNAIQRVDYIGNMRWIKPNLVTAGVTNGAPVEMFVVRGRPSVGPMP